MVVCRPKRCSLAWVFREFQHDALPTKCSSLTCPSYKIHIIRGGKGRSSPEALLQIVEEYFRGEAACSSSGVRGTSLPPLYFQTPSTSRLASANSRDLVN